MLQAAKDGYAGKQPQSITVLEFGRKKISWLDIEPPLQIAMGLGAQRRAKFQEPPSPDEILRMKGHLIMRVCFQFDYENGPVDVDAEAALQPGQVSPVRELIRPIEKMKSPTESGVGPYGWSSRTIILYHFDFGLNPVRAPKGKVKLLVRRSDREENEIELDFDKLSRNKLSEAKK